jgi:ATP-dependent helicase/nuclease subunit A
MLGMVPLAAAAELGESRAGNLLKSLAAARGFSADGLDFGGVLHELERLREQDLIEQMSVEPGRPGVVRLMTLHGAKGLEAKVVFLAEPAGNPPSGRDYWIDRNVDPPAGYFRVYEKVGKFSEREIAVPAGWEEKCELEEQFERAEATRLLYVGATRAEELLVVSIKRTATGKASGPWCALEPFLGGDLPRSAPAAIAVPPPLPGISADLEAAAAARADRRAAAAGPTHGAVSVTALSHSATEKPAWESTGRGMSWGRVMHGVLEALMRDPKVDARAVAANLLAEEERPPAELEEIVRLAVPFAMDVPREELGLAEGPPRVVLQGAIDLVFEEDDGWVLVDYKSDAVTPQNRAGLVAFYARQVDTYRRYWRELTGRPTRAGIFFAQTGDTEWIPDSFPGASTSR